MKPWVLLVAAVCVLGCSKSSEQSLAKAKEHAGELVRTAERDVAEVRSGLPEGARQLSELAGDATALGDAQEVKRALDRARNKVQDLRVAKSTFFAWVDPQGTVVRTDQEQDLLAGKNLFASFPELRKALSGARVETVGSMPEAAEVAGRKDGQWLCAVPVSNAGSVRALYVTGWSWSAYAYRLENALRGSVQSSIGDKVKMPLLYVYMVAGDAVHGAPVAPEVNAKAIAGQAPLTKLAADGRFSTEIEITGRSFALAVQKAPVFGSKVAIAVLRSET
ncbi:MAG TPA: hypothetical protein VK524_05925 [Polyangiaceae bacterium]|nr:hypothetical protein [Polyangiaceae bacterium]